MYARGVVISLVAILTACGGSAPSPSASTLEAGQSVAPPAVATAAGSSEPTPSPTGDGWLQIDGLAKVLVTGLNLRAQPSVDGVPLGTLPLGESAYVVGGPVEADGYEWYQLASLRQPYSDDWFGWAAAVTPDGDQWLAPLTPACPTERNTEGYLALLPAERLACAGDAEWRLTAYIAEEGGRGCMVVWYTVPLWLSGACNLLFPQPVESQFDSDERLQSFVHPDLGVCGYISQADCPFAALRGSWVEMVGHLNNSAASTCRAQLADDLPDGYEAPPPPDPQLVVFRCRLAFVVTAVRATSAPSG